MVDFLDKTGEQDGTPINRVNLMAMQGFQTASVRYRNGEQIITYPNGHMLRSKIDGNTLTETFIGEKTITKTTNIASISREEVIG